MQTAHRVIKNTGFLYAKMGITMFISLYTTRLILNALGTSDFGVFNVVGGTIAMLGFLNAAMAGATQRFMSYSEGEGDKEKQKKIFNVSFILHFGIAIAVGIVLLVAGYLFFNGVLNIAPERIYAAKVVYASLIVSTIFTVMTVPYDAVLNAHENMLYYSIVGVVESLLKLGAALVIVHYSSGDKLILYSIFMACIPLVIITIMRIYCHKHYKECVIEPKRYWDKGLMKEMTSFAGWNLLGTSGGLIGNYGSGIIANHFFGTIVNAAIGIVVQANGQLMAFSNNMLKALNPVIVKKEGCNDRQSMLHYSLLGSKISFSLLAFFSIPIFVEAPYIFKLWLKVIPMWTIVFIRIQLIRTLLEQLTITFGTSLAAQGDIKGLNITTIISNLIPLPILFILFELNFPPYWMLIIPIIFMVCFGTVFKLYYACKLCDLSIKDLFTVVIYPSFILFVVTISVASIPHYIMDENFHRFILSTFLSVITFCIVYYLLTSKKEKQIFIEIYSKIKSAF
jgi:O-antigen/teichoic acid export membrane protein